MFEYLEVRLQSPSPKILLLKGYPVCVVSWWGFQVGLQPVMNVENVKKYSWLSSGIVMPGHGFQHAHGYGVE